MPQQGYSLGQDLQITINFPDGPLGLSTNDITSFNATPDITDKRIIPVSGNPRNLRFHEGWSLTLEGERNSKELDDYWTRQEAGFYNGENELGAIITQTIKEKDGTISRYLYTDVILKFDEPGTFKGNDSVTWRMTGRASRKIKI